MKKKYNRQKEIKIKLFLRFLKDNEIYKTYLDNLKEFRKTGAYEFLSSSHPISFISNAFGWMRTKEGRLFWNDKHELWIKKADL